MLVILSSVSNIIPSVFAQEKISPPSITFKEIKNGCKVFKLDAEGGKNIKEVSVFDDFKTTTRPPSVDPLGDRTSTDRADFFDFSKTKPGMVELTVCPQKDKEDVSFSIIVGTTNGPTSSLSVHEKKTKTGVEQRGFFSANFFIEKRNAQCLLPLKDSNLKDVNTKCEHVGSVSTAKISGTVKDITKPGLASLVVDPPSEFFLIVLEVCIEVNEETLLCPENEFVDLRIEFPSQLVIGGEIIPIETTALLLAGAQTSVVWMAPLLFAAAGIAIIFIKKKRN